MGRSEPCPSCGIPDALRTKQISVTEEVLVKEGNRPIQVITIPYQDKNGEWLVDEVNADITERKRAEQELEESAEALVKVNAELERSNRDLEEFTHTVSHDLQEPLRKIHTFGQFLVEDLGEQLPESAREHLRRMQEAAVRMQGLIQHLLGLARVGSRGRKPGEVAPRMVIDKVLDTLSERVRESGAEISVAADLPWVMADPVQLEQVFQNLLSNALKFRSPDRVPKMAITAAAEGEQVRFAVSDNGIGIDARFLERIFGIFQRLYAREQYEGAGVGLALCAKIVRRHGGRIWVESEVGRGSTFHFTLPAPPPAKEGACEH
jgi:light-regulated signal transduction histidine kinase (bacteriophytochrome)